VKHTNKENESRKGKQAATVEKARKADTLIKVKDAEKT
jgi:hypothetical protein